jgi:hypothetical protein
MTRRLLAGKAGRISEIADDSSVAEMQFRRGVEFRYHASRNDK